MRVAARSSAFTFKGKGATVAEVGRVLNVATVLEGSVRKAGNPAAPPSALSPRSAHPRRRNQGDRGYLEQALERDPAFALAWAELGRAYQIEAEKGWTPLADGVARARESVARALALEPDLAEGHTALGGIQMSYDWDWRGAEASFARAVALAPRDGRVLHAASALAQMLGRLDEAIGLQRRAIEQDPLSANTCYVVAPVRRTEYLVLRTELSERRTSTPIEDWLPKC